MNNINKVKPTLSSRVLNVTNRVYICEGYHQQQPIVIARFFMGFTQSSDDYTIYNILPVKKNIYIKWLNANCSKYLIQISNILFIWIFHLKFTTTAQSNTNLIKYWILELWRNLLWLTTRSICMNKFTDVQL